MLSQVLTLVGVFIGALTSYLSTTMAERTRHRRTLETRWDERKIDTYIEYSSCVKEMIEAGKRSRQAEEGSEAHHNFLAAMEEAERKRAVLFEALALLASPAAVQAADVVNRAVWKHLDATRRHVTTPVVVGLIDLMNTFHEKARHDLGIPQNDALRHLQSRTLATDNL
ncbi:hypothetical protein [Streptomyces sp. 8N706]|uniref:hypothetical protein n=1 Tax=Streptomyces sp. 8N706 TaxID=3457416 RepID=UPI003FD1BE3E